MAARAILRVAKLKGAGKAAASGEHLERTRATPNADPDRQHLNRRLLGTGDLWADIQARLDALSTRPRSNAVHAIEHLLTASPSYFADGDPQQLRLWAATSVHWARERYGRDNVVAAMLHMDEETPHLHVVAVPIVEKTLQGKTEPEPRLCARDFTGGRYRLSRLQDSYWDAVKHLGLERGVKGARIEYEHLHQRYAAMTETPPRAGQIAGAIRVRQPDRLIDLGDWAAAEQARLRAILTPAITAQAARIEELERRLDQEQRRAAALQRDLSEAVAQAAQARALDLGRVLATIGGVQERHDPHLWRIAGERVSIDGSHFRNLTQRHEGVGAIELLTHLTGCDYSRALAHLAHRGGPGVAASAAADHAARQATRYAERIKDAPAEPLRPVRTDRTHDRDDHGGRDR